MRSGIASQCGGLLSKSGSLDVIQQRCQDNFLFAWQDEIVTLLEERDESGMNVCVDNSFIAVNGFGGNVQAALALDIATHRTVKLTTSLTQKLLGKPGITKLNFSAVLVNPSRHSLHPRTSSKLTSAE